MQKRMKIMLISLGILFGSIFLYKAFISYMIKKSISSQKNIVSVASMTVEEQKWQPELTASGSLRAIRGVNVTTELAGMVQTIQFKPGDNVKKGDLLVQLNADTEIAQLHSLEANAEIAKTTYLRDKAQYQIHAISKQIVDNDAANLKSIEAQVEQQKTIIAKKSIIAPFTGKLGVNNVNPGQYVNPGDKVVTIQTLDPIYADFYIPQQQIAQLKLGQEVFVTSNAYPKNSYTGKITTIEPTLDPSTRNVQVEATVSNDHQELLPGMFVSVRVITGEPLSVLTIPQAALSFNSYGNLVYVIEKSKQLRDGKPVLIAKQHFVTTGDTRGEQIMVLNGLKSGDEIVISGQLKLKNGSEVAINNSIKIPDSANPTLPNNH